MICKNPTCQISFEPTSNNQKFHSVECRHKYFAQKQNRRRHKSTFIHRKHREYKYPMLKTDKGLIPIKFDIGKAEGLIKLQEMRRKYKVV
jgi:hypothetical protein